MIEASTDIAVPYFLFGMSYEYCPQENLISCRRSNSTPNWSGDHLLENGAAADSANQRWIP